MQITRVTVQAQIVPTEAHLLLNLHSAPPTVAQNQALPPKVSYEHTANDHKGNR